MQELARAMAINASRLGFMVDMGIRGTGTAQFDYADASEQYLLPRPLIIYLKDDDRSMDHHQCLSCSNATIVKYLTRFGAKSVVRLHRHEQLDPLLQREGVTHLHILSGDIAPPLTSRLPTVVNLVHTVFDAKVASTAHVPNVLYARVSPSVATWKTQRSIPVVPHIVRPAGTPPWTIEGPDLRSSLGIPQSATVFCRHGGPTSFNREAAQHAVQKIAMMESNATARRIHFIFVNTLTGPWCRDVHGAHLSRMHILRSLPRDDLPSFIRSCDAMIHGRTSGEMFGLALAEFAILHKPIFTSAPKGSTADMHFRILGKRAIVYDSTPSLVAKLLSFDRDEARRRGAYWNAFRPFDPYSVMQSFSCVFLHGGTCNRTSLPGTAGWPRGEGEEQAQRLSRGGGATVDAGAADVSMAADPCHTCSDYYTAFRRLSGDGKVGNSNPYAGVPEESSTIDPL